MARLTCVAKVRKDGSLAVPKVVREQLGLQAGDELKIVMQRSSTRNPLPQIQEKLDSLFEPAEGQRWLHTRQAALDGRAPIDLITHGEADRVLQILVRLEEGMHN
jgi:AbrB family looped-hinge helix DNA binding protein